MEEIRLYLRRILFMIQKELIATLKDKKSRLVLLMPVLVQTLAFGYVATYNLDKVQYAVLDQNRSRYSAELLSKIDGSPVFTRAATLETPHIITNFTAENKVFPSKPSPGTIRIWTAVGDFSPLSYPW